MSAYSLLVLLSIKSDLSLLNIPRLFLWNVHEIDGSIVGDNCQSIILGVKANRLHLLIHLDFGQAEITVPVFVEHFHKCQPKNGRVIKIDLIKSSGNIRFDNSAIKAISRVETFSFFNKIPFSMYQTSFKNIVITFNPV